MSVRVLVVEDEAILAIDIADQLTEAGFLVVGPAPSVAKALKLIEDVFLNGERMRQAGRPDPRPDYRDESTQLGNLLNDFNFGRSAQRPLLFSGSIPGEVP